MRAMAEIELVEVEETLAIVRSAHCSHSELPDTISRLYGELMTAYPEAEMTGPPRIYYLSWDQGSCVIEAAIPVETSSGFQPGDLKTYPAVKAAKLDHVGPYTELHKSWEHMWGEMGRLGLAGGMPCWDSYVTDPEEEPDTSQWLTELYIPLAG